MKHYFYAAMLLTFGWALSAAAENDNGGFRLSDAMGIQSPWEVRGWSEVAYYTNNIPLSFNDDDMLSFDDLPGRFNLAQQWFYLERKTDGANGLDFGGRIDVVYGTDAQKSQSYGNPGGRVRGGGRFDASLDHGVYGWAIPQLYGEVASGDFSVMVGHFISTIGYEETQANENFFHSHSLSFYDSEPFTHTGFLSKYDGFERLTLYGGWTAGWDTGFDQLNGGSNFLGGVDWQALDEVKLSYHVAWGNFGWRDGGGDGSYVHSVVLKADLTDKLQYVAHSDLLDTNNGPASQIETIGLVQYLIYEWNDIVGMGGRCEWWKRDGTSHYEITGGLNLQMLKSTVLRPEVRHDWSPGRGYDETVFAIDAVVEY